MTKPIKLPIFWNTDETSQLDELGLPVNLSDCGIRQIYFFNIDAVTTCNGDTDEENEKYTKIFSAGTTFICKFNIVDILKILDK